MATLKKAHAEYLDVYSPARDGADQAAAETAARSLERLPHDAPLRITGEDGTSIEIPAHALSMLQAVLDQIARGRTVALVGTDSPYVTTAEAARILRVSRPHVVKLVDLGVLPSTKTSDGAGAHRRLRLTDVLAYRSERTVRRKGLRQLQELTHEVGGYEELGDLSALPSDAELSRMLCDGGEVPPN